MGLDYYSEWRHLSDWNVSSSLLCAGSSHLAQSRGRGGESSALQWLRKLLRWWWLVVLSSTDWLSDFWSGIVFSLHNVATSVGTEVIMAIGVAMETGGQHGPSQIQSDIQQPDNLPISASTLITATRVKVGKTRAQPSIDQSLLVRKIASYGFSGWISMFDIKSVGGLTGVAVQLFVSVTTGN